MSKVENDEESVQEQSVLFTCEIFYEDMALPKSMVGLYYDVSQKKIFKMFEAIETTLHAMFDEQPIESASYMIHTLNKNRQQVSEAIETLKRYLNNIINNFDVEKYRRIRISNKVFSV
jgi:hypothetical protein